MNGALSPEISRFIQEKVSAGFFALPEEAVNAFLSNAAQQEELTADDLEELRSDVDKGIAEADRGEFADFTAEDIIAQGRTRHAAQRKGAWCHSFAERRSRATTCSTSG